LEALILLIRHVHTYFLDSICRDADTDDMSNRRSEFLRLHKRKEPVRNADLAKTLQEIELKKSRAAEAEPARREIDYTVNDRDRERAKDSWIRDALLARARGHAAGAKYVPPTLPPMRHAPPPLKGWEERMESERTGFDQTAIDLKATFKKRFMPTESELRMNRDARRFAAQREPEPAPPPQSDMIKRLDVWIRNEKERAPRRRLEERLMRHFPAMGELEIGRDSHGVAEALEELHEALDRDARRHGLDTRKRFVSRWMRRRYDAFKRAGVAHLMNTFHTIGHSKTLGRGVALASVGLAFVSAISGSDEVREYLRSFMESGGTLPIASADTLPSFAPDSIADVSIPHPTEPVPVANTEGSPNVMMVNGDSAGAVVESPGVEAGEAKPNALDEDTLLVVEPIEVQGNVSVWSSLLDSLDKKGIDLHGKEQAFAEAVQRAIEDTGTQGVFLENNGSPLSGVAWNKIPDGATIHFDLLFGNQEFLDRLKELLESSEYRTLGKEIRSLGGAELFISDIQDAFGVHYL
jgi:hypothetical protein